MSRDSVIEQWHPECYMIFKLWSVKLSSSKINPPPAPETQISAEEETRRQVSTIEKVSKILAVLSAFEESSAECIQEMLTDFSSINYSRGVIQAEKFISHIEALFKSLDLIEATLRNHNDSMGYNLFNKEPKHLAKKIVAFFTRLSQGKETTVKSESTKQLIELVTNLARELKGLIRFALKGSLKLDNVYHHTDAVESFLDILSKLGQVKKFDTISPVYTEDDSLVDIDLCISCQRPVEDANAAIDCMHWHLRCIKCLKCEKTGGGDDALTIDSAWYQDRAIVCADHFRKNMQSYSFLHVTQLDQYIFLLRCALKRLCIQLNVRIGIFIFIKAMFQILR